MQKTIGGEALPLLLLSILLLLLAQCCDSKAIGCVGFGFIAGNEDDLSEESCEAYLKHMDYPMLPRGGETRHPSLIAHQNLTTIEGDPECSGRGWLLAGKSPSCVCFYEAAGEDCSESSGKEGQRPKAAIVYLLYGSEKYFELLKPAVSGITMSFLQEFPYYDLIVFHSENFERADETGQTYLQQLQALTFVPIKFVRVDLDYRPEFRERFSKDVPNGMPCGNYSVNYLHMGRFFQYTLFRHPAVAEYDYLWRLDADLETRLGIPCDVFEIAVRSRSVFGYYYYSDFDHHNCGLFEGRNATFSYAKQQGFTPKHLEIMPPQSAYIGIWGVFQMSFWKSDKVMAFSDYMDGTALAYTNRLGEQAYYVLATALLVSPAALHQYAGLGPFMHRGNEIIMGRREVNGFNLIRDDVFCPEASRWDCNEIFECVERTETTMEK